MMFKRILLAAAFCFWPLQVLAQTATVIQPAVQGPSSATSGHIATFNGTSGQIIQDGGAVGTGTVTSVTCFGSAITTTGTCTTTGQLPGTATNNDASAGNVGEYISSTGSAVSLVSATSKTCTSISLTAGDWDVTFVNEIFGGAGTTQTSANSSISTTNNTVDTSKDRIAYLNGVTYTTPDNTISVPSARFSLASTTTVYGVGTATFSVSTDSMNCSIHARRVR